MPGRQLRPVREEIHHLFTLIMWTFLCYFCVSLLKKKKRYASSHIRQGNNSYLWYQYKLQEMHVDKSLPGDRAE